MKTPYLALAIILLTLFLSTGSFSQTSSVVITDSAISTNVKAALSANPSLADSHIGVSTQAGIVSLTGKVNSDSQLTTATQLAESVAGVKDVDTTQLIVNGSDQPFTDSLITAKVRGMFIQHKLFGSASSEVMTITVETTNGTVYLGGTAASQDQINKAIALANSVAGVKGVKSGITLAK